MHAEAAMERRKARAEFVRDFPGRLESWVQAVGKSVIHVHGGRDGGTLVLFHDGTFLVTGPWTGSPDDLQVLLLEARLAIEPHQPAAYAQLDALRGAEAEAMRLGRMEKVLGAVQNNLAQIPELREALLNLLQAREVAPDPTTE
jgi:diglucosylglycerate octanoyltransferase